MALYGWLLFLNFVFVMFLFSFMSENFKFACKILIKSISPSISYNLFPIPPPVYPLISFKPTESTEFCFYVHCCKTIYQNMSSPQ